MTVIENGSMATKVGIISESQVIQTRSDPQNYIEQNPAGSSVGGSLYSPKGHMGGRKNCPKGSKKVDVRGCLSKPKGGELMSRSDLRKRLFE